MTETLLKPLDIVLLAGGTSEERAISLQSGAAVAGALEERGHRVWWIDPAEIEPVDFPWSTVDAAFLTLHGTFGEDGQVQEILERVGIPFTGSDARASSVAFSKSASKERFLHNGVPTAPYVLIHESDSPVSIAQRAQSLGYPLVCKPDRQGSSLGISWVRSSSELPEALLRCFEYDKFGILECALTGSEWTVGLLDDLALPPICIETDHTFFDYQAKYEDETTRYRFGAGEPNGLLWSVTDTARQACAALAVRGLARVDIRLDQDAQPRILEVNTIPGMTDHSLVPKAAERAGIDFATLCELTLIACLPDQSVAAAKFTEQLCSGGASQCAPVASECRPM